MGLDLADPSDGSSSLEVDLLIGSDQYRDLETGETRRGQSGPVAINTDLGWVLSGPSISPNNTQPTASLIAHTLLVDSMTPNAQALDDRLKSFWELEPFGVFPPSNIDQLIQDGFESSVRSLCWW